MPSLEGAAPQDAATSALPTRFRSAGTSQSRVKQGNRRDLMTSKIDMPMWLQVIASISIPVILALLALVALINPQFAELRTLIIENRDDIAENREAITALDTKLSGEIAALDTKLSGEIAALDLKLVSEVARLDNRITVEVTRIEDKFDALANLMIVALTNGEPTEAELIAIWESFRKEQ